MSEWDQAIADTRELLDRVEQKAVRLRGAIQTFKESGRREMADDATTGPITRAATQCLRHYQIAR
jgi:hypothetical protein